MKQEKTLCTQASGPANKRLDSSVLGVAADMFIIGKHWADR